jgi:hypothetical protein
MPAVDLTEEQRWKLHQSKVIAAYKHVFGTDDATRTDDQRTVWTDLQIVGYSKEPVFKPDKDGALCPLRAAFADGRRSVITYIETNATFSPKIEEQQPAPKRRK